MLSEHVKCSHHICLSPEFLLKHFNRDSSLNVVLFIKILHNFVGAGASQRRITAKNIINNQ